MSGLLQALDHQDESAQHRKPFPIGSLDAFDAALRKVAREAVELCRLKKENDADRDACLAEGRPRSRDCIDRVMAQFDNLNAAIDEAEAEASRG